MAKIIKFKEIVSGLPIRGKGYGFCCYYNNYIYLGQKDGYIGTKINLATKGIENWSNGNRMPTGIFIENNIYYIGIKQYSGSSYVSLVKQEIETGVETILKPLVSEDTFKDMKYSMYLKDGIIYISYGYIGRTNYVDHEGYGLSKYNISTEEYTTLLTSPYQYEPRTQAQCIDGYYNGVYYSYGDYFKLGSGFGRYENEFTPIAVKGTTPQPIEGYGMIKHENDYYFIGGYDSEGNIVNKIYCYNVQENTYTLTTQIPQKYVSNSFDVLGKTYIVLGETLYEIYIEEISIDYSIKNNDGTDTYVSLLGEDKIKSVYFRNNGNIVSYRFTTDGEPIEGTYSSIEDETKQLVGFSFNKNSKIVQFPIGHRVEITIDKDTTFYEVYAEKHTTQTIKIELYQNSAEENRIDKTEYLDKVIDLYGVLRDETSITNPSIIVEYYGVPNFNYCYIEEFGRYYFIDEVFSVRNNLWELSLRVDVLMTYKNNIYNCYGFVDRCEFINNPNIYDDKRVSELGTNIYEVDVETPLFKKQEGQNGNMVMITGFTVGVKERWVNG